MNMLSKDSALNHDMGSIPTISFPNLTAAKEQSPPLKPEDINWLNALENIVGQCIGDFGFNLDRLSQEIYLSPRQTRRRLKNLIGLSFSQYVKTMRMAKAYQLLQNGSVKSIRGLAYEIGMRDVKYFSKQFKLYFGVHPSFFTKQKK